MHNQRNAMLDPATPLATVIARNTLLLAASMAALYAMGQLVLAIAALTFATLTSAPVLAGMGPALFMLSGSIAALLAGRAMDRYGRVPVLAVGFGIGVCGALITAVGVREFALPAVVTGFILLGIAFGTGLLSRVAAADMYTPERRAWGIALVLFGAVFGALLGPLVFMPMLQGSATQLPAAPWYGAAGFMLAGLLLVLCVRPDPCRIAEVIAVQTASSTPAPAAPLKEILRRPGVRTAIIVAVTSYAVMVGMMAMIGYLMTGHGHTQQSVFPVLSAHFMGMFALVLLVGKFIGRIGRPRAMLVGLVVLALAVLALMAVHSVALNALALFGIGLGWNIAFVAATAELTALTTAAERGSIIGFSDLLAGASGAVITLLAGVAANTIGLTGLSVIGALLSLLPVLGILVMRTKLRAVATE
ncbi:MAG TPA: MFS transporter [Gammaproteobacteria bacterium]|nr:MFS transporter [Gammaproteobacteria bacterium]